MVCGETLNGGGGSVYVGGSGRWALGEMALGDAGLGNGSGSRDGRRSGIMLGGGMLVEMAAAGTPEATALTGDANS